MNLLLVAPHEVDATGRCSIADDRAAHLRSVLKVEVGSTVRAGIAGVGVGSATVLADDGAAIALQLVVGPPPPGLAVELILAIPRPKVITRTVEIAASFGIPRLDLTNAWRVEKSYLDSPRLVDAALVAAAWRGAAQGATTHVPEIAVHRRLMGLFERTWDLPGLIAHPGAPPIETVAQPGPCVLAIGPEGGWIQRELDTFVARGFQPVSFGAPILRVEAAVAAALAQLMMIARKRLT